MFLCCLCLWYGLIHCFIMYLICIYSCRIPRAWVLVDTCLMPDRMLMKHSKVSKSTCWYSRYPDHRLWSTEIGREGFPFLVLSLPIESEIFHIVKEHSFFMTIACRIKVKLEVITTKNDMYWYMKYGVY